MRFLITGGPVHAKLDAVKIITNRFKGGLMAKLAEEISQYHIDAQITYLTAKGAATPAGFNTIYHDGIHDYMAKVLELAPKMDAVVLGAAVANLIPVTVWEGKFPSHNYQPGDLIPIDFQIAPRIIDAVKNVAPKVKLFGFKLLDGDHFTDEHINAAYAQILEAKATAVFANYTGNLDDVRIITRERGQISVPRSDMAEFIVLATGDTYYTTQKSAAAPLDDNWTRAHSIFDDLVAKLQHRFKITPEGYVFGTIAVKLNTDRFGFLTTGRGKNELSDRVYVEAVDHEKHEVRVYGDRKATLNAPLLDMLFTHTRATRIVHLHEMLPGLPTFEYAPSGTVRDSMRAYRCDSMPDGFNIRGHGCYLFADEAIEALS